MVRILVACFMLLVAAMPAQAVITFQDGWNSDENSNAKEYSKAEATEYLLNKSDDLRAIIDGPKACVLQVTKGCHQPADPHFTSNGVLSTPKCKVASIYVGSKSIHTRCP